VLSSKLNHKFDKYLGPAVRGLARLGISPNMLTVAGAATNLVAAVALLYGYFRAGGILVILGGLCDLLDGALARTDGRQTRFGEVLDSTLDRYSDIVPIFGLLLYYSGWRNDGESRLGYMALCGVVILGSLLVPYVRARAESLVACNVGTAERAERVIIFAAGLIFLQILWALVILAILTHVTVIQRLLYVRARLTQKPAEVKPVEGEVLTPSDTKNEL
jgi:CDP-diacylglycerol--glycerol-3-phosphate 3-phosphatidyltransferase